MKRFTQLNENFTEKNNGNALINTGVTNHYTPVQNILTNINNLFCVRLSVVGTVAEDGVSIKLTSSKFISQKAVDEILNWPLYADVNYTESTLGSYIMAQGLNKRTLINIGGYYIVYFSPSDIKTAENPLTMCKSTCPTPCECTESFESEFEYSTMINEDDGEEEMKSQTVEKVLELLDGPDKVKAAKQLELLVSNEISLPREYYFSAVKFKSGEEAIALRWKFTKKMPFGQMKQEDETYKETTVENTRSIMHIFGKGEKAIWVQDFDKDSIVQLPEEVKKLIESILDILDAGETDDPSVFSLTGERKERKDKDEDKDKDENNDEKKDDEKSDDKDKNKDENDDEDDDSRGDTSDDLLG